MPKKMTLDDLYKRMENADRSWHVNSKEYKRLMTCAVGGNCVIE